MLVSISSPTVCATAKCYWKGLQPTSKSHVLSDTPQRQPVCAEDPAEGHKKLQAMQKWLLSQIKGRPPWPGIWTQREILLSVEWWLEKQTSVEPRSYKVLPCWLQLYEGMLFVHQQRLHRDPSWRSSHIAWITQSSSAGTVFTGFITTMKKLKIHNGQT